MAYEDDVNLIGDGIRIIERNAGVFLNGCKGIGPAVSSRETKYMEKWRQRSMIAN